MTLVTIDLGDVAGGHDPDDHVIVRAEAFRESQGGGITSTAEVVIPLVDGVGQAEVEPGPVVVAFRCRAVADTREKRGVVPGEGPVGIEKVLENAFEYLPPVVNRALETIEGAVAAEVDARLSDYQDGIQRGTGEKMLTIADAGSMNDLKPGTYSVPGGATSALGMPTNFGGTLDRAWLNAQGTNKLESYTARVGGIFTKWWRFYGSQGWEQWQLDSGHDLAAKFRDGYEPILRGTGERLLTLADAPHMDSLRPGKYTIISADASLGLGMPVQSRGVLNRAWLNGQSSHRLDQFTYPHEGGSRTQAREYVGGAWSEWTLGDGLDGSDSNQGGGVVTGSDDPAVAHAITTDEGHILQEFRRDGTVLIPGLQGAGFGPGYQFVDGELRPSATDMTTMVGWGSSSMNWLSYELSKIAETIGAEYVNEGKGGEVGDATAARLGSRPAQITFPNNTIPASVEVVVTTNVEARGNPEPFTVTAGGVEGVLELRGLTWYFIRSGVGEAVVLDGPVTATPVEGERHRGAFTILNLGKNSFRSAIDNMPEYVAGLAVEAFDYLSPVSKRALVIGHFVDAPDLPGTTRQAHILAANDLLSEHFGPLYVDMQGMIESPRLWELSGLTPTAEDLAAQQNRVLPPSVRMDEQHLNAAGLRAVGLLVREKMTDLNWI